MRKNKLWLYSHQNVPLVKYKPLSSLELLIYWSDGPITESTIILKRRSEKKWADKTDSCKFKVFKVFTICVL